MTLPTYIRFSDLKSAGIAGSWTQVLRMIEVENFPTGVMLSANIRAWRLDEIENWLAGRPTGRKLMPEGCVPGGRRRRSVEQEAVG
jgi:predicted DNA-binding transcriptional regulator AlpA